MIALELGQGGEFVALQDLHDVQVGLTFLDTVAGIDKEHGGAE